jgi:hypothetical protein
MEKSDNKFIEISIHGTCLEQLGEMLKGYKYLLIVK